jgi:hypothetical protein
VLVTVHNLCRGDGHGSSGCYWGRGEAVSGHPGLTEQVLDEQHGILHRLDAIVMMEMIIIMLVMMMMQYTCIHTMD